MKSCPDCNRENREQAKFCAYCRFDFATPVSEPTPIPPQDVFCNNCGEKNNAFSKFCEDCGASLTDAIPAPPGEPTVAEPAPAEPVSAEPVSATPVPTPIPAEAAEAAETVPAEAAPVPTPIPDTTAAVPVQENALDPSLLAPLDDEDTLPETLSPFYTPSNAEAAPAPAPPPAPEAETPPSPPATSDAPPPAPDVEMVPPAPSEETSTPAAEEILPAVEVSPAEEAPSVTPSQSGIACGSCGNVIRFCPYCGAPLNEAGEHVN